MKFTVFYMRPSFFPDGLMGYDWLNSKELVPTVDTLGKSHVELKEVEAVDLEDLFSAMQGDNWSPNGEARPLIKEKGLHHTSMSVGDIARFEEDGAWEGTRFLQGSLLMCDISGWVFLGPHVNEA